MKAALLEKSLKGQIFDTLFVQATQFKFVKLQLFAYKTFFKVNGDMVWVLLICVPIQSANIVQIDSKAEKCFRYPDAISVVAVVSIRPKQILS